MLEDLNVVFILCYKGLDLLFFQHGGLSIAILHDSDVVVFAAAALHNPSVLLIADIYYVFSHSCLIYCL